MVDRGGRRTLAGWLLALLVLTATTGVALAAPAPSTSEAAGASQAVSATVRAAYTLPDIPLAQAQHAALPNTIPNDRKFLLGGIGSDLWRAAGDPPNEFWVVTDRGPNGQIRVDNVNRRTFPVPEFTPLILKVRAEGDRLVILQTIPIVGQSGKPVTGLSNLDRVDETPYDATAQKQLPFNPNGLDPEGLVRTAAGEFWLADEYRPSLVRVDATGKVIKRYIPAGVALEGADYPVAPALPAIYALRKGNRGFEGLALGADGRTVYLALQSPLLNPNAATGNASRNTRILAFDTMAERVTGEWVYRFDEVDRFDPKQAGKPDEMKVSGVVALSPDHLLVLERTDEVAKLYQVDLRQATNILGSRWDDRATTPSLEALTDPATAGVTVLPKQLVVDLTPLPGMPGKIEGVALVDRATLAVINDNDFDVGQIDAAGNNAGAGAKSRLLLVALSASLPLPAPGLPRTGGGGAGGAALAPWAIASGLAAAVSLLTRRRARLMWKE